MAAAALRIYIDMQNRALVQSFKSTSNASFPTLRQGESPLLQLFFLNNELAEPSIPYEYFDFTGATIKMGMMKGLPTGGTDTLIASQFSWLQIANGWQADLDCNTTEIVTALGTDSQIDCTVEIEVIPLGGDPIKFIRMPCIIQASVIDDNTPQPAPIQDYLTRTEAYNVFVKHIGLPGETVLFVSPDGTVANTIGTANDGTVSEVPINPYTP